MNPSASPQGRGDRVFTLFIIGMTHTALTEPLEGEGYKFKQEDGRRPRPHVPSAPTHAALANFFFLLFFCSFFEGKRTPKAKQLELNRGFLRRVRFWVDLHRWKHFVHTHREKFTHSSLSRPPRRCKTSTRAFHIAFASVPFFNLTVARRRTQRHTREASRGATAHSLRVFFWFSGNKQKISANYITDPLIGK